MFAGVRSVPMVLHSSRSVGAMLESLQGQAAQDHWRALPQLAEAGLERNDYSENDVLLLLPTHFSLAGVNLINYVDLLHI
jgi:hypothetical protein